MDAERSGSQPRSAANPQKARVATPALDSTQADPGSTMAQATPLDGTFVSGAETTDQAPVTARATRAVTNSSAPTQPPGAAAQKATPAAEPIPEQMGDFKIIKKLGQGGMGAVYLAHQISLDRQVALKVMAPQVASKPGFVERFYREARAMAKLDHPNVVRGYAVGEANGQHFVAMELIDGKSMQDWLDKLGRLSAGDALHVVLKAADALQHAHELGLVHRDIKPDNMLLTSKGVVKVSDLGLAKQVDEDNSMTQSGTGLGTPYYMPPEQARNAKHVDQRSDIYALGSTLYHFVTGDYPFKAESTLELIMAKEKSRPKEAHRINPEIPERLSLIIDKTLMKDPKHRYQTCAELIHDIEALGLANATLSFVPQAAGHAAAQLQSRSAKSPATVATGAAGSAAKTAAAGANTAAGAKPAGEVVWAVRYPDQSGKLKEARFKTEQMLTLIKNGQLDLRAKATKKKDGDYLPLAQYTEFEQAVKQRLVKIDADKKANDVKSIYAKIDRQEQNRKRWRWLWRLTENTAGLVSLVVYLVLVVAAIGGGGYALVKYVGPMVAQYFKLQS